MPYSVTRYCTVERGRCRWSRGQGGHDAGLQLAILALHGGGQADEGLTALGQIGAHDEVQLAAGAGDLLDAGGLGVHLTEEVQVHDVVDGDEVVQLCNDAHVVGVVHGSAHDLGFMFT